VNRVAGAAGAIPVDRGHSQLAALRFALARLRRAWAAGELRVLALALVLAAAAAVAVGQFADRVGRAIERNSGDAIGADAIIKGKIAPPETLLEQVRSAGLRSTQVLKFQSMASHGEHLQLATVRAVSTGYPLRGELKVADQPFGIGTPTHDIPPRGSLWIDPGLWSALGLKPGDQVQLGAVAFKVDKVIIEEPGRSGAFAEFAPTLLLNAEDLPATQLLGPGSRIDYTLQLGGDAAALEAFHKLTLPTGLRYISPQDSRPEIRATLRKAHQFLDLAAMATLLLCGAAVSLSARQHAHTLADEIALLKSLGAQRRFLRRALGWQMLLLGLVCALIGALAGSGLQATLAYLAAPALQIELPAPSWRPLPAALLLVELLLAGFALPPLAGALNASPLRVFQRTADAGSNPWLAALSAFAAAAAIGLIQAGDWQVLLIVAGGAGMACAVLAGGAWLLVRVTTQVRSGSLAWRFGLGNLARRRSATVAQVVALGVSLLALLLVTVVRQELLASWQGRLPAKTPNQFLINIQPEQKEPLRAFFAAHGHPDLQLVPMVRARLTALNGQPVTADSFSDPETRSWINREFNLSWVDRFGDDNTLLKGQWWDPATRGEPWLSATDYGFERLNLKLGDKLTLDIAGRSITLSIYNERKVNWDSFRPNFFLVTPPGVLEDAGATQWITSFYLPADDHAVLRELVTAFPNVTALDLDAAMTQVRTIMSRIVRALSLILGFALLAGLVVILAVIEGSKGERRRETAILRALGASSRVIVLGLLTEYAALGLIAGTIAAAGAQLLAWALAKYVLEIPFGIQPGLWVISAVMGCGLVTATGWLSLRGTLRTSPRVVLAG